ncbi:hypothetical protein D3C77_204930 [compost metagenome]
MVDILNFLIRTLAAIVTAIMNLLPQTPFTWDMGALSPHLGVVNYFIPFAGLITITGVFLTATLAWYAIRWILRLAQYID